MGESNYNHLAYLELSRQYGKDALALIRRDPARYLGMLEQAWRLFLFAPSDYDLVEPNRARLGAWDRLYDAVIYGIPDAWTGQRRPAVSPQWTRPTPPASWRRVGWLWFALSSAAVCHAGWLVSRESWRRWRAAEPGARPAANRIDPARLAALAFCVFNVVFVSVAANAVELGENNRFRVAIEPLLAVLVAYSASRLAATQRRGSASWARKSA
jgi:hypothetical protein